MRARGAGEWRNKAWAQLPDASTWAAPLRNECLRLADEHFAERAAWVDCWAHWGRTGALTWHKCQRFAETIGVALPDATARDLCAAIRAVAHIQQDSSQHAALTAGSAILTRVRPYAPSWFRELIVHCIRHEWTACDDYRFFLRAVRLMRGVATGRAAQTARAHGFTKSDVEELEMGALTSEATLRRSADKYGVPYPALLQSYLAAHYPWINWDALRVCRQPFFVLPSDVPKLRGYLRASPTFGEALMAGRKARQLSMEAMATQLGWEIAYYDTVESGERVPEFGTLSKLEVFVPRAEMLRLLLAQQYPALLDPRRGYPHFIHPRLTVEPIHIPLNEPDLETRLHRYTTTPGSFGEELYWARRRAGYAINTVVETTGRRISRKLLYLFEHNLALPTTAEADILGAALGTTPSQRESWHAAMARTSTPDVSRALLGTLLAANGTLRIEQLRHPPDMATFRQLLRVFSTHTPATLATLLQRQFFPDLDLAALPCVRDGALPPPVLLVTGDAVGKLRRYVQRDTSSLGESILVGRLAVDRLWSLQETAARLDWTVSRLQEIEAGRAQRITPAERAAVARVFARPSDGPGAPPESTDSGAPLAQL
ncbi:MAG: helix-turn-helix transcriptional regulator [Deltaproteobacteria bacterium]|nr:helix-turn-helix transcriptional regulator [Deltaproteobacteria bacterium]